MLAELLQLRHCNLKSGCLPMVPPVHPRCPLRWRWAWCLWPSEELPSVKRSMTVHVLLLVNG